jgi:uncharacterized protein
VSRPLRCAVCRAEILPRGANRFFPFCSLRCRRVDLGKWLGEEYRVGAAHAEEQEDELPDLEGQPDLRREDA